MKPTRPINATGNPFWKYSASNKTNVAATIRRVTLQYAKDWTDAHAQNEARNLAEARDVVRPISRKKGGGR